MFGPRSVSSDSTGSANESNLVFTIPPDLSLSDPERSVLAKGLKFVPTPAQLICSPSRKIPKLFTAVYVLKAFFTISHLPIIIRIFLNKSILKVFLVSTWRPIFVSWSFCPTMSPRYWPIEPFASKETFQPQYRWTFGFQIIA